MSLAKRYQGESLPFLIRVIEHASDFTPEAVQTAKDEIQRRNPDPSEKLKAAREVVIEDIDRYLDRFSVVRDALELPTSHYLNEEEVKLLFRTRFSERKGEFDDMIPDAWKYAIGGF